MTSVDDRTAWFRALHVPGRPLLLPNPWDAGTAVLLASLGFAALGTTSSGYAATLGRADGAVDRDDVLTHVAGIVAAVDVPVSADLEYGFADGPDGVHATVAAAAAIGVAGCSIEDWDPVAERIVDVGAATERIAAAVDAAGGTVLTARAENHFRGIDDLPDTIARLQAFQEAGADVLYAPGLTDLDDVRRVVAEVDRPVNVLARRGLGGVAELAEAGVARISVGGAFGTVAREAVARAGRELLDPGTFGFLGAPREP